MAPITNTATLEVNDLDKILVQIGYPKDLIKTWDINQKRHLVSYGGKVVKSSTSELSHEYISLDGEHHIITPESQNRIREIQINDLKELGVEDQEIEKFNIIEENNVKPMAFIEDGKWSARLLTVKIDKTSHDYKYLIMMEYFWESQPIINFGDVLGIHWGHYGQPVADSARGIHSINYADTGEWINFNHDLDQSSIYGITSEFDTNPHGEIFGSQLGILEEQVYINKEYSGNNLTLSAEYGHPWLPNNWSLSADIGGLSFSGDLSIGDRWTWRHNFIP